MIPVELLQTAWAGRVDGGVIATDCLGVLSNLVFICECNHLVEATAMDMV